MALLTPREMSDLSPQRSPSRLESGRCLQSRCYFRKQDYYEATAVIVETTYGWTAAFDPKSPRRLSCGCDRIRAVVFGWGERLRVDVAGARSSIRTNEP